MIPSQNRSTNTVSAPWCVRVLSSTAMADLLDAMWDRSLDRSTAANRQCANDVTSLA
jgi:hypothetical protein